jgi:hypothetical protein
LKKYAETPKSQAIRSSGLFYITPTRMPPLRKDDARLLENGSMIKPKLG